MIDDALFRQVMSRFASGVTVVTTNLNDTLYGLTVSSFASLSLQPRLVFICINVASHMHDVLLKAERWAINILASDQEYLSRHFAGKDKHNWREIRYQLSDTGTPWLAGVLTTMECRMYQRLDGGDHSIFVGELESGAVTEGEPLLYFRGGYRSLGPA